MKDHALITTLKNLSGNPRGCVYTEPLWGIPYNLYAPYISVYMLAFGLTEKQIGLIVSLSWSLQIVMALLSGVITDKIGRRRATLLFDLISWSLPSLISAIAQNFWFFLAAGLINSFWRVTHNSWTCLLVEDADHEQLVDIYSWIYIAGLLVGFIAPLTGLFIQTYSLVSTMRALYFFAAFMFTVKALLTYQLTHETGQGLLRMHQTSQQHPLAILAEYRHVFIDLLHTPRTLYTTAIMLVLSISQLITGSFWSILVTEKLRLPAQDLALFPFVRSLIMLLFFFVVMPRISAMHFKYPLMLGFLGFVASQLLLISAPPGGYFWLVLSIILEACSLATVYPLVNRLTATTVDARERARLQSLMDVGIILLSSPFGWIAGTLSTLNKDLPFILNIILFLLGALLAILAARASSQPAENPFNRGARGERCPAESLQGHEEKPN